jgi:predicted transport protein
MHLELQFKKSYIAFVGSDNKNIFTLWIRKNWQDHVEIVLHLKQGQLNDPRHITYEKQWDFAKYGFIVESNNDINYIISLIKQAYDKH